MKSIIKGDDEFCFLCKRKNFLIPGTDTHHMIFGTANRKLSDKDGLTCHLCHTHHMRLHQYGEHKEELQKLAQITWMEYYEKSIDEFRERYGKNYL